MAEPKDGLFDSGASDQEDEQEVEALRDALHDHLKPFFEQHEDPYGFLPLMLIEMAMTTQMMHYTLSVEKPSGSGLRMDLDRFRRDIDDVLRSMKKQADDFVAHMKQSIAELEAGEKSDPNPASS